MEAIRSQTVHALDAPSYDGNGRAGVIEICGLQVHAYVSLSAFLDELDAQIGKRPGLLVTFVNPGSYAASRRMASFKAHLQAFDRVLPDGVGLSAIAARRLGSPVTRISFDSTSLALPVFQIALEKGLRVALVGGAEGVAQRAAMLLQERYAKLDIVLAMSGHQPKREMLNRTLMIDPDIVVCGMGGGVQEAFLLALRSEGWMGAGFTCGGYLDQLGEGVQYYPEWVDRLELRWLYRLCREPRRLWRRYIIDYGAFGLRVLQDGLVTRNFRGGRHVRHQGQYRHQDAE